ncbi:Ribosomal large subunit pseudouridine synthase D [compost metagenome]
MWNGTRKGEWWELEVPDVDWSLHQKQAYEAVARQFPIPKKLWGRLYSVGGIRQQENKLLLHLFPPQTATFQPEYSHLDVLFEDDFCMVVNKPAGMPVHPTEPGKGGTLANAVAYYYEATGQACTVRHIHRLDGDTTGAVLYAKNEIAHMRLDEAMREQRIDRQYVAVAEGIFLNAKGTIDEPIGRDRHHSGKRRVTFGGDEAITHYWVEKQFAQAALVRLELETGRTHQIRVHLSHMGHPLIGDAMYGGSVKRLQRQALHGERLLFEHPLTGVTHNIHTPWPPDFLQLLSDLQA